MNHELSQNGACSEELAEKAHQIWSEAAATGGTNIEGFNPGSSFDKRCARALMTGYAIGTCYCRFSTKMQHSTEDQMRECLVWAARNGIYVPPELVSIDEGVKGRRQRRVGLQRTREILHRRIATVLLVYKVSRLFRQAGKGFDFVNTEVVEEGLRAVSVSQGIDTDDKKSWKLQMQIHGLLDDILLDAIADHVRSGQVGLFLNGWTTGALGVGFRPREIPGAPPTNRGLPRTMPEVDPEAADLICRHGRLHLEGMSLKEGLRRWNAAGGPCDPRSTTGKMTYPAYRRLWSNPRLTGRWQFGRKRNQFSSKLDSVKQIEQPESEVVLVERDELRILDDETFFALQKWLDSMKSGPRGPRKPKQLRLWDLTTGMFFCACCSADDDPVRFYMAGAGGKGMRCKNGDDCPCKSSVRREEAVKSVCRRLTELIARDRELVASVISRSQELDATADEGLQSDLDAAVKRESMLTKRIDDLFELMGEGSEADRSEMKARLRAAQSERTAARSELDRLVRVRDGSTSTLSLDEARLALTEMSSLLTDAASGELGEDAVYKALEIFRAVTGGRIMVHVERRAGRKRTNVRGEFQSCLVRAAADFAGGSQPAETTSTEVESVWLREPPRLDLIAKRVHELINIEGKSHRETAKQLQREGHKVNSGNVWYSYQRWYEMQGEQPPKVPYNNGRRRRPRRSA